MLSGLRRRSPWSLAAAIFLSRGLGFRVQDSPFLRSIRVSRFAGDCLRKPPLWFDHRWGRLQRRSIPPPEQPPKGFDARTLDSPHEVLLNLELQIQTLSPRKPFSQSSTNVHGMTLSRDLKYTPPRAIKKSYDAQP